MAAVLSSPSADLCGADSVTWASAQIACAYYSLSPLSYQCMTFFMVFLDVLNYLIYLLTCLMSRLLTWDASFQRAGSLSGCLMSSSQTPEAVQCTGLSEWVLCWTEESPWLLLEMTCAWASRLIWYSGQGKIFYLGWIFVTKMNDFIWCVIFPMFPFPLLNKCLQVYAGFHLPCVAEVLGDKTILASKKTW